MALPVPSTEPPLPPVPVCVSAPPRDQRGMVLMMTLLMVALLSVMGAAAVLRSSTALKDGGAQRIERAAYRLSEAGTMASVALAAQMQGGFQTYVAEKGGKLSMVDMGDGMLDLDLKLGSFGSAFAAVGNIGFATEVDDPDLSSSVPGYDAGRFCFKSYRMVTTSQIGSADPQTQQEMMVTGQAAIAAQMTVGPVVCGQ